MDVMRECPPQVEARDSSAIFGSEPSTSGAGRRWRDALEQFAGLGFWRMDRPGGDLVWSNGSAPQARFVLAASERRELRQGFDPDDLVAFDQRVDDAFESGADFNCAFRYRRANGSWRVMSCEAMIQRGTDGAICGLSGVVVDVTELEICRVLTEDGHDIITQTNRSGVMTYVSPSVVNVTGYRPEELIGRPVAERENRLRAAHFIHPGCRQQTGSAVSYDA